jgi:muramoyltetrapeptide carboxypeptidase
MKRKDFLSSIVPLGATLHGMAMGKSSVPGEPDSPTIIPPYLKKGDTIGITCPAGFITLQDIQSSVMKLKEWGFQVKGAIRLVKKILHLEEPMKKGEKIFSR